MTSSHVSRRTVFAGASAVTVAAGLGFLSAQPALAATSFIDVPDDYPFAKEITWTYNAKISIGWSTPAGREFRPGEAINRDAMAAFLYRFAGSPAFTAPRQSPFVDVATSHPFYREICWLYATGVSTGWIVGANREFRPWTPINRDAMAAFLYRFAGSPVTAVPQTSPFIDIDSRSPFYKEMCWLYSKRISTGWVEGSGREFRPTEPISRGAMAAFLYRFNQAGLKFNSKPTQPTPTPGTDLTFNQDVVKELLVLVNVERAKTGARALKLHTAIQRVAQTWSDTMARTGNFVHNPSFSQQYPAGWRGAAENIAQNYKQGSAKQLAAALMNQWMNSAGHRKNILNPVYTHFGAGVSTTSSGTLYACQNFAAY